VVHVSLSRQSLSSGESYENLIHRSLRCRLDCSARDHGRITTSSTDEVVRHLLVELLCRLLGYAARPSAAATTHPAAACAILADCHLASLAISSRLRLGVGLCSALGLTTRLLVSRQKGLLRIDLRDARRKLLRLKGRHFLRVDDDLDLKHMSFRAPNCTVVVTYLDGTVVNGNAVEILGGLRSTACLAEDDRGDATALARRAVCELNLLDGTDSLAKVIL
jgi:hypothetical protein